MENQNTNPLLCDIETGLCQMPDSPESEGNLTTSAEKKPIKLIYYTDPICSSCWGIEPQFRKLKLEYGHLVDVEYRMGGLLPDWSYNSGGISKPSDVAHHWDEVSHHYDMPIDGDVWLEDPLDSSYPPSIAFKAAQLQSQEKAVKFLRKIREMVFLQKKNITKWEHLAVAAQAVGLDVAQLKSAYEGEAKTLFSDDLALGRKLGVRGFPSMFFVDGSGNQEFVYGTKPYSIYENAILTLYAPARKVVFDNHWTSLFAVYSTLTTREFSELSGMTRPDTEPYLQTLTDQGNLTKLNTKNGIVWTFKNAGDSE
jgi:predicted DsbA family dithiol-disulfide isomerase